MPRLCDKVDVLLCNPPYVATEEQETGHDDIKVTLLNKYLVLIDGSLIIGNQKDPFTLEQGWVKKDRNSIKFKYLVLTTWFWPV